MRFRWLLIGGIVAVCGAGVYLHRASADPLPSGSSHLVVYQAQVGAAMYVEGSKSYVRISSPTGGSDTTSSFVANPSKPVVSQVVAPGSYTVESWQRPCDGKCGVLDPETDQCESTVTVAAGRSTTLVIILKPGHGCTIEPRGHF